MPSVDEIEGDLEYAGRRWLWVQKVANTQVEGLRRVDISVRREDDAEGSSLVSLAGFVGATATATGPSPTRWNAGGTSPGGADPGGDDGADET
jgi:hypothetical protein